MLALLLILAVIIVLYAVSRQRNRATVSYEQIKTDLQQGAVLVDVRTPGEYAGGHAAGAHNLPLDQLRSGTLPKTAKDKAVYVYCHSGARATAAKRLLQQAGFQQVINLGGLHAWQSMGGTVTK